MRKCFLCGSLIRRRAEFCRYCTVRQTRTHGGRPNGALRSGTTADGRADPAESLPDTLIWPDPPEPRADRPWIEALEWSSDPEPAPVPAAPEPAPHAEAAAPRAPRAEAPPVSEPRPAPVAGATTATVRERALGRNGSGRNGGHDAHPPTNPAEETHTEKVRTDADQDAIVDDDAGPVTSKAANGTTTASEPCPSDHLGGFAHFPGAGAKPKVRWR